MAFHAIDPQPAPRGDEDLTPERYDERVPGLYPGELALRLDDDGTLVAASVDQEWLANGAGVSFKACARWIDEDGTTHLCPRDQHVETLFSHRATTEEVKTHGSEALALEALLLVLGDPPRLTREIPVQGGGPAQCPVLDVSDEVRASASVKAAVAVVNDTPAQADLSALMALAGAA